MEPTTTDTDRQSCDTVPVVMLDFECDIEEDVPGELQALVRHSKFGLYKTAHEIYEEALEPHVFWFPVAAEYAGMLLEQGNFKELEAILHKILPTSGDRLPFSDNEIQLLRLFGAMAEIHTKGLLKKAIAETDKAEACVKRMTMVGSDADIIIQIQILRLKILNLGWQTSSFIKSGPWKAYLEWHKTLLTKGRCYEAQVVLTLCCDYDKSSLENLKVSPVLKDAQRDCDEHCILEKFEVIATLFTCRTRYILDELQDILSKRRLVDLDRLRVLQQVELKSATQYLQQLKSLLKFLDSQYQLSGTHSRLRHLTSLYEVDLLALTVATQVSNGGEALREGLHSARRGLADVRKWAMRNHDYAIQLETFWRLITLFDYEELLSVLPEIRESWKNSGNTTGHLFLLYHLYEVCLLTHGDDTELKQYLEELCRSTCPPVTGFHDEDARYMVPLINHVVKTELFWLCNLSLFGSCSEFMSVDSKDLPPEPWSFARPHACQFFLRSVQRGLESPGLSTSGKKLSCLFVEYTDQLSKESFDPMLYAITPESRTEPEEQALATRSFRDPLTRLPVLPPDITPLSHIRTPTVSSSAKVSILETFRSKLKTEWKQRPDCSTHGRSCRSVRHFVRTTLLKQWMAQKENTTCKTNCERLIDEVNPISWLGRTPMSILRGDKACVLVLSCLLHRVYGKEGNSKEGYGNLVYIFQSAGIIDKDLQNAPRSFEKLRSELTWRKVRGVEAIIEHFERKMWAYCPMILRDGLDEEFESNLYLPFIIHDRVGTGGTANVFKVRLQQEFVSKEIRIRLEKPFKDPMYGDCYEFALKSFPEEQLQTYKKELETLDGLRYKPGIIRSFGHYSCSDTEGVKTYNILLKYGRTDLLASFFEEDPPQLRAETVPYRLMMFVAAFAIVFIIHSAMQILVGIAWATSLLVDVSYWSDVVDKIVILACLAPLLVLFVLFVVLFLWNVVYALFKRVSSEKKKK